MRLKRADITHFRSIRKATVIFDRVTRLIGGNGSGKSTIVRALDLFYAPAKTQVSRDDFFSRDEGSDIEIALTFTDFSQDEKETFKGRISDSGEMTVTRVFTAIGGKSNGRYHGIQLRHPGFQAVRNCDKATEKRIAYRELLPSYQDLDKTANTGAAVDAALVAWEKEHHDECKPMRDDGQFFGFESVAQGRLQSATSFVFVPAVRDAAQDVAEGRNTPITVLMDLIVRSAIEARPEIQEFRSQVEKTFEELTDPAKLTELGDLATVLTGTLQHYYPETTVELDWLDRAPLSVPLPGAGIRLNDDGFSTSVDRTGHGVHRALVMTLLQHLATASVQKTLAPGDDEADPPVGGAVKQPDLILAIEEPELYQHPTKQRHFAAVLESLSTGKLPGVGKRVQIVYCTHSPIFVSTNTFEQIRLLRRESKNGQREACPYSVTLDEIARTIGTAHKAKPGVWTGETLRPRLHVIDTGISEGFFAAVTVIVEGASDRAAIIATAKHIGADLERHEIAVVIANGKNNIDKPAAIFRALQIPTYAIWDCDQGKSCFKPDSNHALQRLFGVVETNLRDAHDCVEGDHACFRVDLETTLKDDIGADTYDRLIGDLRVEYGIGRLNDAQKSPLVMQELIKRAAAENKPAATLEKIVRAILAINPKNLT